MTTLWPDCTCSGPARDRHDSDCPVRKSHPRADLGDVDGLLYALLGRAGGGIESMRRAYSAGQRNALHPVDVGPGRVLARTPLEARIDDLECQYADLDKAYAQVSDELHEIKRKGNER